MLDSIGTPMLWAITLGAVVILLAVDFVATRKPHEVSMREAAGWSVFYVALPLAFGVYVWSQHGSDQGVEFYTGYLVEKTLSVDNLFVFMLLLTSFAVPATLQQRVLLYGIVGALVMRAVFIALGAAALSAFSWVFLLFGLILILTGLKLFRDSVSGQDHEVDPSQLRVVRAARRLFLVTDDYQDTRMLTRLNGRRALTPLALVVLAVLATDLVFAVDSVPAVYGITEDPYLVFVTNAFALLGLRALYFVLRGALSGLVHLSYGLAAILVFIGIKLGLHWAHEEWATVPEIPTLWSLIVIVAVLALVTTTSVLTTKHKLNHMGGSVDEMSADKLRDAVDHEWTRPRPPSGWT
jgi:tellurite resistance protein TerC